jgi:hypothetical protein
MAVDLQKRSAYLREKSLEELRLDAFVGNGALNAVWTPSVRDIN